MYQNEVLSVKELGEAIGYGNMMDIASMLWEISAIRRGDPVPRRLKLSKREKGRRDALMQEINQYF